MRLVSCFFIVLSLFLTASAQAQTLQGTYGDWKVFTHTENGRKLCYIASTPKKKTGNYTKRGEPFVLVTHRSPVIDEVSVSSGFPYKKGSEVAVAVDKLPHALFTEGERAWAYDEKGDAQLVRHMAGGARLVIKGVSEKGTKAEDTYSLDGFTKARRTMKTLCN